MIIKCVPGDEKKKKKKKLISFWINEVSSKQFKKHYKMWKNKTAQTNTV